MTSISPTRKPARARLLLLSALCLFPGAGSADLLPSMDEMPWTGYFSGHIRHGFDFGIDNEGQCEINLMGKGRKRVGVSRKVKITPEVIIVQSDGTKVVKKLKRDDGFATEQKPGLKNKSVTFTAESYGEAKVEVSVEYDGNRITMDGKILDLGSFKDGEIFLRFKVRVPAMYTSTYAGDEKKAKARMKRDRVKFVRSVDGKSIKLKSYEKVDLADEKLARDGISELRVTMDGMERRTFIFGTQGGKGTLAFENKTPGKASKLWQGYVVKWRRKLGDKKSPAFQIEVK